MKHALLVEDLSDIREWLSGVVQTTFDGAQVHAVGRCDEAIAAIAQHTFDLALIDLGLPDGSGIDVVAALRAKQPNALPVVVTIFEDDEHLFPALKAGAFGYLLKDQPQEMIVQQLLRMQSGEPPLSPSIARRVLAYFAQAAVQRQAVVQAVQSLHDQASLTEREAEVLRLVAKGFTMPEIAQQLGLSRHTVADHVKSVYRKLNVSSRAEAALEAARRGLVGQ